MLRAAADLLFEHGMPAMTFERIATTAGVSKMTLYKWWASPGALALEAYFSAVEAQLAFPDSGDVARDLSDQLHAFVALLTDRRVGRVIAELIGRTQTDPPLAAAFAATYSLPRRRLAVERIGRGQQQGQIAADVDPEVVVDQLWGACYHRLLLPDQPLDAAFADALLRNVLTGITQTRPRQPSN